MTETAIVALVGVLGTLVGAIGGALIARSGINKQLSAQRRFALQDATRVAIVTLLDASEAWKTAVAVPTVQLATAPSMAEYRRIEAEELPIRDTRNSQITQCANALLHAATEARLLVVTPALLDQVAELRSLPKRWEDGVIDVNKKSLEDGKETAKQRFDRYDRFDIDVRWQIDSLHILARDEILGKRGRRVARW